jgi:hypothetical protein
MIGIASGAGDGSAPCSAHLSAYSKYDAKERKVLCCICNGEGNRMEVPKQTLQLFMPVRPREADNFKVRPRRYLRPREAAGMGFCLGPFPLGWASAWTHEGI